MESHGSQDGRLPTTTCCLLQFPRSLSSTGSHRGYLRFQAQYLRRIRLPAPESLPASLGAKIKKAFRGRDFATLDNLSLQAYALAELPVFDFVDTRGR
jgi:hypothetical protein